MSIKTILGYDIQPGVSPQEYESWLFDVHAPDLLANPHLDRIVFNKVLEPVRQASGGTAAVPAGQTFYRIAEMHYTDEAAYRPTSTGSPTIRCRLSADPAAGPTSSSTSSQRAPPSPAERHWVDRPVPPSVHPALLCPAGVPRPAGPLRARTLASPDRASGDSEPRSPPLHCRA